MNRPLASAATLLIAVAALAASLDAWRQERRTDARERVMRATLKTVEAQVAVTELAWAMSSCAERTGALPASSTKVPADEQKVRGIMYQSSAADWTNPAFQCAAFHMIRPQRYQYQWQRVSQDEGIAVAEADLDGDGRLDDSVTLHVRCTTQGAALHCRPDPMPTAPKPLDIR